MRMPPALSVVLSLATLTSLSTLAVFLYTALPWSDPNEKRRREAEQKSRAILRRLDGADDAKDAQNSEGSTPRQRKEKLELTSYEQTIALDVVTPEDIPVSFEDVGGLDDIIEELKEFVIYPLTMPELYLSSSSLLTAPSGVLLYGPPGCGKTMLAKALAHESGACFINLHISTLTEKWYGDSNKLANALFSLARKLEPTIVFIDEIDAVLGKRHSGEHEASGMVKAEFMTHWDGLTSAHASGRPQRIVILGATNRYDAIDDAILRRMPKRFAVGLPQTPQRLRILEVLLKDTKLDPANFDINAVADLTAGMSGSDIREICREAAMTPLRELLRQKREAAEPVQSMKGCNIRGVRTTDFLRKSRFDHVQTTH